MPRDGKAVGGSVYIPWVAVVSCRVSWLLLPSVACPDNFFGREASSFGRGIAGGRRVNGETKGGELDRNKKGIEEKGDFFACACMCTYKKGLR